MAIITQEQFDEQIKRLDSRVLEIESDSDTWARFCHYWPQIKKLWARDKIYAVKQLNWIEKNMRLLENEERALLVVVLELLQKLILHKKKNPPKKAPWRFLRKRS